MVDDLPAAGTRRFEFARDTFAFQNETFWEYHFDRTTGRTSYSKREPKPTYAHRCFVLTRAARQFFFHVRFDPAAPEPGDAECGRLIKATMARNPRRRSAPEKQIVIPGYANLREFSQAREALLKAGCGGAWQSYVLRSHWRMVFPISREHQSRTAASLAGHVQQNFPPVVHLMRFPAVTINHSFILFDMTKTREGLVFHGYDPNQPRQPVTLSFDHKSRTFSLPGNHYWAGGELEVIEIFRSWLM